MPTWFGYKTNEELAAEAAAKKAAEVAAAKQAEKVKRELEATKFQNEQLNYRLKGELPSETTQDATVKRDFLRKKTTTVASTQTTPATAAQKNNAETGVVTAASYTFIGQRMFQDRVVRKNETPVSTEKSVLTVK